MAEIGLAVAQTLFAALDCKELRETCAAWGYKTQLEELNKTVKTVQRFLEDAQSRVLSKVEQGYIDDLKDALYEADDLFDEFVTLLELDQLHASTGNDNEFFQQVCRYFSSTGLKKVKITTERVEAEAAEAALKMLEPHPNLKEFYLSVYGGRTIPWWRNAKDDLAPLIQLSNLATIHISNCDNLVNLPSFRKLPFLNFLRVSFLENLEYMETRSSSPGANDTTFFPSLVHLQIWWCPKLKGWFREEGLGDADCGCWGLLSFPCLSKLRISGCLYMTSFPPCPTVETLTLIGVKNTSRLLEKMMGKAGEDQREVTIGSQTSTSSSSSSRLATLKISGGLESLSEYEKVFQMCASLLKSLEIRGCHNLNRFSRGLEHLTALESLQIGCVDKLDFSEDNNEDIMAWQPLHQSLHYLRFDRVRNMKRLPEGMKHLTSLQILELECCDELKELPECISSLSSLQSLTILGCDAIGSLPEGFETLTSLKFLKIKSCSGLVERLKKPNGQDWQKIQHIPQLLINPEESLGPLGFASKTPSTASSFGDETSALSQL